MRRYGSLPGERTFNKVSFVSPKTLFLFSVQQHSCITAVHKYPKPLQSLNLLKENVPSKPCTETAASYLTVSLVAARERDALAQLVNKEIMQKGFSLLPPAVASARWGSGTVGRARSCLRAFGLGSLC